MMAPVWMLLVTLFVLGGLAAVVGLGVFAVVKNRPGIIAGIGGLLLLLVAGGLLFALVGVRSVARGPEARLQVGPVSVMEHVDGRSSSHRMSVGPVSITQDFDGGLSSRHISGRISWGGLLLVLVLPVALLFAMIRSMSNRRGRECGGGAWVPAIFALALLGFVGFAGTKWKSARHYSQVEHGRRNAEVARQIAEVQADVARQKAEVARQAALAQAEINIQQRIAQADIHKLMDEVDAPRIPLPPVTPTVSQASAIVQAVAETPEPVETPVAIATSEANREEQPQVKEADAELAAEAAAAVESIDDEIETKVAKDEKPKATSEDTSSESTASVGKAASTTEVTVESVKVVTHAVSANDESANKKSAESAEPAEQPAAAAAATNGDEARQTPPVEPARPANEADLAPAAEPVQVPTAPRPAWANEPPKRVGETAREVIVTDEYASLPECTRATDVYLLLKTYERMQELVGRPVFDTSLPSISFSGDTVSANGVVILTSDGGGNMLWNDGRIRFLQDMGIGVDYVRREVVAKDDSKSGEPRQHFETVERSFGPMHKLYTQIEFSPAVDRELRQRWESRQREERLAVVGVGAGGILGLLGMVYGMLKVDTWTKGYYTKRLFLGVPAAIIGLVSLLSLFS